MWGIWSDVFLMRHRQIGGAIRRELELDCHLLLHSVLVMSNRIITGCYDISSAGDLVVFANC